MQLWCTIWRGEFDAHLNQIKFLVGKCESIAKKTKPSKQVHTRREREGVRERESE